MNKSTKTPSLEELLKIVDTWDLPESDSIKSLVKFTYLTGKLHGQHQALSQITKDLEL